MNLSEIKVFVDIIQSSITVIAIIVGGFWSYMLFVSRRQKYPRMKVEHYVSCRSVVEAKSLLSVDIIVSNTSEVLLSLMSWEINARQMLPPCAELFRIITDENQKQQEQGRQIIEWQTIASREDHWKNGNFEIEPGEQHQIHLDFVINTNVQTLLVESYFRNMKKRGRQIGWSLSTIHDLQPIPLKGGEDAFK